MYVSSRCDGTTVHELVYSHYSSNPPVISIGIGRDLPLVGLPQAVLLPAGERFCRRESAREKRAFSSKRSAGRETCRAAAAVSFSAKGPSGLGIEVSARDRSALCTIHTCVKSSQRQMRCREAKAVKRYDRHQLRSAFEQTLDK